MGLKLKKPFYWVYCYDYTLGFYSTLIRATNAARQHLRHEVVNYDKVDFTELTDTYWEDKTNGYWIEKITEINRTLY